MKALTWQGKRDVRVEEVPDPRIEEVGAGVTRLKPGDRVVVQQAPEAYELFQSERDGCVKVVLEP